MEEITNQSTDNSQLMSMCNKLNEVKAQIHRVIVGQEDMIELMLIGLLTRGHVLIEGVPGIAKTLTTNLFAKSMNLTFKRLQFTPDLMPSDVVGTNIYDLKNSQFEFKKGPIFGQIILIDEINRAPAKTQAALFEVMEEKQVTNDGKTYKMQEPFMILATQNPIEQEGTYRLPEAQQDRFIFKIEVSYPTLSEEIQIIQRFETDFTQSEIEKISSILTDKEINDYRQLIQQIQIKPELIEYIAKIISQTRNNKDIYVGASPRASLSLIKAAKCLAAMQGRNFVTPDDIKKMLYPVLSHRITLSPEKEMDGYDAKLLLKEIIENTEIPR